MYGGVNIFQRIVIFFLFVTVPGDICHLVVHEHRMMAQQIAQRGGSIYTRHHPERVLEHFPIFMGGEGIQTAFTIRRD